MNGNGKTAEINVLQTLHFCEENFGYNYFSLMVPPFPPQSILILGYGEGIVHRLIEKVWPIDANVTGVDHRTPQGPASDLLFVQQDAELFVQNCKTKFDMVIVDLYNENRIPPFVFKPKFINGLSRMTMKLLAVNCTFYKWDDFNAFDRFFRVDCVKQTNRDRVLFFSPKVPMMVV